MEIYLFLVLFLIVLALLVQQNIANEIAVKKGYEFKTNRLIGLIPIYGIIYFLNKENKTDISEGAIKYAYTPNVVFKTTLIYLVVLVGALIVAIPSLLMIYLSFNNNLLQTLITIYVSLLLVFTYHSLVVDIARKKGYEDALVHVYTLLPIIGIVQFIIKLINKEIKIYFPKNNGSDEPSYIKIALVYILVFTPLYGLIYYLFLVTKKRNVSNKAILKDFSFGDLISRIVIYGQITLVAVIVIIPVIYIFGLAFSNVSSDVPSTIWPDKPTFDALWYLFDETRFVKWYTNTLMIAMVNMLVGTVLITGAAYVFARYSFKGKKAGLLTILVLQAFPSFMGLIAMYVLFWTFNLLGKPLALSILYIGGSIPGNLWLIKGFLTQIPKDLDESAMIDGANKLQIFIKIILPLSVPILTFVAVSMFMGPWMDYMLPGYLLNYYPKNAGPNYDVTQQWTLAVGLFKFINDPQYMHYSAFAMGALLVGIPITILYMAFQKYLIEGIMAGATKG